MTVHHHSAGIMYRSPSPSNTHYESAYLKRTNQKPPPSLAALKNRGPGGHGSSGESTASLPVLQQSISLDRNLSFHSVQPKRAQTPPMKPTRPLRAQSPIDMILDTARRRSMTPQGMRRLDDQRSISASPLPLGFRRAEDQRSVAPSPLPFGIRRIEDQRSVAPSPLPPGIRRVDDQRSIAASALPLGKRRIEDQRSIAASPLSFYRSPSPLSVDSQQFNYTQRARMQNLNSQMHLQQQLYNSSAPNSSSTVPLQPISSDLNPVLSQHISSSSTLPPVNLTVEVPPAPIEAMSPGSHGAYIGPGPEAASPNSNYTGRHSALTEVRTHSASIPKLKVTKNFNADEEPEVETTTKAKEESKSGFRNKKPLEKITETREDAQSLSSKRSDPKDEKRQDGEKESKALKFDPDHPERYYSQLAVRVSSEILKSGSGSKMQKYAEAAQMSVIKSGEVYLDASPETINIVASKASMAILDAGGDARVAALATITILNADDDSPTTEEEIKAKMTELYGSARELVKKGYSDSSQVLSKISEVASSKLKEVAADNMQRVKDYRDKGGEGGVTSAITRLDPNTNEVVAGTAGSQQQSQPGLLDFVDVFVSDIRNQYNRSRDRYYSSRRSRSLHHRMPIRRDYYHSSDEDSFEYERRRPRRMPGRSGSFSDDSTEFDRPRRMSRNGRPAPVRRHISDGTYSTVDDSIVSMTSRRRSKSRSKVGSRRSRSTSSHSSDSRTKSSTRNGSKSKGKSTRSKSKSRRRSASSSSSSDSSSATEAVRKKSSTSRKKPAALSSDSDSSSVASKSSSASSAASKSSASSKSSSSSSGPSTMRRKFSRSTTRDSGTKLSHRSSRDSGTKLSSRSSRDSETRISERSSRSSSTYHRRRR